MTLVRSLNKNFDKLDELLLDLGKIPELIAISETKLQTKFNSISQDIILYKMIPKPFQVE